MNIQPSRTFFEFNNLMKTLYPNLNKTDCQNIYDRFLSAIQLSGNKDLVCYHKHRYQDLKRTLFISPEKKTLYVTLKTEDIRSINRRLKEIQSNRKIKKAFGPFLSQNGLILNKMCRKHFKPLFCFNVSIQPSAFPENAALAKGCETSDAVSPSWGLRSRTTKQTEAPASSPGTQMAECLRFDLTNFSLAAKVSRKVLDPDKIDEEMFERFQYNKLETVPKIFHSHYYKGKIKGLFLDKHVEISELLDRDLLDSLNDKKIKLSKENRLSILYGVARTLDYLHNIMVNHGDVKIENIFIFFDKNEVFAKLGDFEDLQDWCKMKDIGGTIPYWAPEAFKYYMAKNPICDHYALDIWSFGWIVFYLNSREEPNSKKEPEWIKDIDLFVDKYKLWDKRKKELKSDPGNPWKRNILDTARKELQEAYQNYQIKVEAYVNSLEKYKNSEDIFDYLLYRCWRMDPKERIKASEILENLKAIR